MAKVLDSLTLPIKKNGVVSNETIVNNPLSTAGQFSTSMAYSVGQYVYYDKKLYRFTTAHAAGAWNASHVTEVTVTSELASLKAETNDLKQELNQLDADKADITADNPEMGAGYAGQLVSSHKTSDNAPYIFRKTPYDSTLEYGDIVGASVAWNQLAPAISSLSVASGTKSVSDDVMTYTRATAPVVPQIYWSASFAASHVFFATINLKPIKSVSASFRCSPHGHVTLNANLTANAWNNLATVTKLVNASTEASFYIDNDFVLVEGDTVQAKNIMFIDLTQMLGTSIADYVYSLETATAGSGVAWLKEHFPKQFGGAYQAYNAGEIKSISGLAEHKSVGFNQWDEVWEKTTRNGMTSVWTKNYVPVLPNTSYCITVLSSPHAIKINQYDANKSLISTEDKSLVDHKREFTTDSQCAYILVGFNGNYGDTYNHDICINISKPTGTPKNGDYVPYEEHSYALDPTKTLRGILKLDSNNSLYADGDVYKADGKKDERFNEVDLGSLDWESLSSPDSHIFRAPLADAKPSSTMQHAQNNPVNAMMSNGYEVKGFTPISASDDKHFAIGFAIGLDTMRLVVIDLSQSSASSFKTAMTGVHLVYEKMTATTETASPYGNPQVINPDGTESYVYTDGAFELPVGHTSEYPVNVSGQLDDILDTPTTNGTYTLQATVTDGAVSYEWVSAT